MSSDIVLTAALRSNLLTLQNTQNLIDQTQLRLATGLKVNSALDNPQSFFTAESLSNRASDLTRLLDGIGQSLRTIEAADNGITALNSLVEQAQSIVSSARDELAASTGEARLVGTVDLSDTGDLTALANTADGDTFDIITTDDTGNQITETITISTGDTAFDLAAQITNAFADNQGGEIVAEITSAGFLSIQSADGRTFRVEGGAPTSLAGFTDLGIGDNFEDQTRDGVTVAAATVVGGNTATSISLFEGAGDLVEAGDVINGSAFTDSDGNTILSLSAGSAISITVNNTTTTTAIGDGDTFQDLVDSINQDAAVNQLIEANFDSATGQLSITAIDDTVDNVGINVTPATIGDVFSIGLGDPTGNLDPQTVTAATLNETILTFNSSTATLDALADDYNSLRDQIDTLVADASYRGVNLLNGDDLTTFFNEDNSNSLTTEGVTFTSDGLGLTEATFRSSTEIELSADQAFDALQSVRSFGSSLANNLSIIQTRQTFTQETINTLQAGRDDLVVADQNEEGANLLALQTRQALGTTSLSLASQSQQSVLRLF